jgi:hypothetical protein
VIFGPVKILGIETEFGAAAAGGETGGRESRETMAEIEIGGFGGGGGRESERKRLVGPKGESGRRAGGPRHQAPGADLNQAPREVSRA